jgi:hypothetical protein
MRGVAGRRLTLRLGPARNRLTEVLRMEQIATTLAVQSLARGGLLLHGGLAVRDGVGFILAGASGAGKSTACRRLPSPWRSLSDDCVLVVRDATGLYRAHPWPTWSLLRDNGRVESWPVGQAVPLKALLFLRQSPFDRAEPVAPTPATALIIESAVHLARTVALTPEGDANRAICSKYLRAARALAATVPAYRLHISLTGQFWNEIERVSAERCQRSAVGGQPPAASRKPSAVSRPPRKGSRLRLVCFHPRRRTFLKLVMGRRVVGSVNDVLREWHIRRPFRRFVDEQTLPIPKSIVHSPEPESSV